MMTPVEDDDAVDLPPLPSVGSDEELAGDLAGVPLGVTDPKHPISLDDSTGLDDFDATAFVNIKDERTAVGDDEVGGLDGLKASTGSEDASEYGYTEGNEPLADIELGKPVVSELPGLTTEDGGAVGIDGLMALKFASDDELAGLAPLKVDHEEGEEGVIEDLDVGLTLDFGTDDADGRLSGTELPPLEPVPVEWSLRANVAALCVHGDQIVAGGDGLHARALAGGTWTRLRARGLENHQIVSLASDGEQIAVGTGLKGVFLSSDGGESFQPANGWALGRDPSVASHVLFDGQKRLWLRAGGAVHRSADGARWLGPLLPAPVAELRRRGDGVVGLAMITEGLTLFESEDGVRWTRRVLPFRAKDVAMTTFDGRVALALPSDPAGPYVEANNDAQRLQALAGVTHLLLTGGAVFGARHLAGLDRFVLMQYREGRASTLVDARSEEAAESDGNHQVLDTLVAPDGALWFALGGGVAKVVPE